MKYPSSVGLATPRLGDSARAVFVSDLHLGSKCCQPGALDFVLRRLACEQLYIVGDFFDAWLLPAGIDLSRLAQLHAIGATLRRLADEGVVVHYLLGNHDRALGPLVEDWGVACVSESQVHQSADGKRLLVVHGDQFDMLQHRFPRTARWAGRCHEVILCLSKALRERQRGRIAGGQRRIGTLATVPFKRFMRTYSRFDMGLRGAVAQAEADGIIFGHTHAPMLIEDPSGGLVANTGDWLENCTLVLESHSGQLELWGGEPAEWYRWTPRRLTLAPRRGGELALARFAN